MLFSKLLQDLRLIFFVLFASGFCLCIFQEINTNDESWFLQVIRRVVSGEVLYRDIYFGVTPLAIYIPSFLCSIFGVELLLVRSCLALYFALGGILILKALREVGIKQVNSVVFVAALLAFSQSQASWGLSGYNSLAKVFFLAVFVFLLKALRADLGGDLLSKQRWLMWAGVSAALCIGSKQNVGAIASLCIVATLSISSREFWRDLLRTFAPLFITLALILLPTVLLGGWDSFMDYAFWNKKRYVALKHNTYFLNFPSLEPYPLFITVAPFLAVIGLIVSWFWIEERERLLWKCIFIFFVGSLFVLFPRPDNHQKLAVIPFFLIAILYSANKIPLIFRLRKFLVPLLGTWLILVGAGFYTFYLSLRPWVKGFAKQSHMAPFSGIFVDQNRLKEWEQLKRDFKPPREGTYFFSLNAGFYFILFDLKNPIPFDISFHSALGCRGEELIPQWIKEGRVARVIRDHPSRSKWGALQLGNRPLALEAFIEQNMAKADFGTLFEIYELPKK